MFCSRADVSLLTEKVLKIQKQKKTPLLDKTSVFSETASEVYIVYSVQEYIVHSVRCVVRHVGRRSIFFSFTYNITWQHLLTDYSRSECTLLCRLWWAEKYQHIKPNVFNLVSMISSDSSSGMTGEILSSIVVHCYQGLTCFSFWEAFCSPLM